MTTGSGRYLHIWLPTLTQFPADHPLRAELLRADRLDDGGIGYLAGLSEYFDGVSDDLPAAALTRQFLQGDAGDGLWLSADPAWVQPDMNGVRLLACGQMQLTASEAQELAEPLRPVFDDAGMQLELTTPDHWHLRLPADTSVPPFVPPEQALGEDLLQHLPKGPEGRPWRVLLNEVQVLLHQHPWNAARRASQRAPVNSLWLWGAGVLPRVRFPSALLGVVGNDLLLNALATRTGISAFALTEEAVETVTRGWLVDLRDQRAEDIAMRWWPRLMPKLAQQAVRLHFDSGERWQRQPWHRWRIWRRAGH